jgi:hypothetical protein
VARLVDHVVEDLVSSHNADASEQDQREDQNEAPAFEECRELVLRRENLAGPLQRLSTKWFPLFGP